MTGHREPGARIRALAIAFVAAAALGAGPASAQTIVTIGDAAGATPSSQSLCPRPDGSPAVPVAIDAFTLQAPSAVQIARIEVKFTPADAYLNVARLEIRGAAGDIATAPLFGSMVPAPTSTSLQFVNLTQPIDVTPTPVTYRIAIVPKMHKDMPEPRSGKSMAVQATVNRVTGVYVGFAGSDATSATITINNAPPPNVALGGITSNPDSIAFDWAPSQTADLLVLRRAIGPVEDLPTEGQTYPLGLFGGGTSQVVYGGTAATPFTDASGVTAGTPYYYRIFVRDTCTNASLPSPNYSTGIALGPIYAGGSSEGDLTENSTKPVVGLVNPMSGPVTNPFRVQVRVFSPGEQPITAVKLFGNNGGGEIELGTLTRNTNYDPPPPDNAWSGVFELRSGPYYQAVQAGVGGLALPAGTWTLRARATNVVSPGASDWVNSAGVGVIVHATNVGDGKILVRDNSDQLCADCHKMKPHSAEAVGMGLGSWFVGCRGCHQPHGTTNAKLIATTITPPSVNGVLPPVEVFYAGKSGVQPGAKVNAQGTGLCQGCHTRTEYMKRGENPAVDPVTQQPRPVHGAGQTCATCHSHETGQATTCTSCHGDKARASAPGADGIQASAPPVSTGGSSDPNLTAVGKHLAHVNKAEFRSAGLACSTCHTDSAATTHDDGTVNLAWSLLAQGLVDTSPTNAIVTTGAPQYTKTNDTTATCSNYCHGGFEVKDLETGLVIFTGKQAVVSWTSGVASAPMDCNSCHGRGTSGDGSATPPPEPHRDRYDCDYCHSGYTGTSVNKAKHIDGSSHYNDAAACDSCHGDATRVIAGLPNPLLANDGTPLYRVSPPKASDDTIFSVTTGAHQVHVNQASTAPNGPAMRRIECYECHPAIDEPFVEATSGVGYQVDGAPLAHPGPGVDDVSFRRAPGVNVLASWGASNRQGVPPTEATCSSTYCHGNFPYGKGANEQSWGTGTVQTKSCDRCHNAPPQYPHARSPLCGDCHPGYDLATKTVNLATHVDTNNDDSIAKQCSACHGDLSTTVPHDAINPLGAAPGYAVNAKDVGGNTATTAGGTGAHLAHLGKTNFRSAALTCNQCHTVPGNGDKSHATGAGTGGARATLSWPGALANGSTADGWNTGSTTPSYAGSQSAASSGSGGSCNTYCHGKFDYGNNAPVAWSDSFSRTLTSTTLGCTSCHAFPPLQNGHPNDSACASCHGAGYVLDNLSAAAKITHINGLVNVSISSCSVCHGNPSRTPALTAADQLGGQKGKSSPPKDVHGSTTTGTSYYIGAHQQHVNQVVSGTSMAAPMECRLCHGTGVDSYTAVGGAAHRDGSVTVPFSGYADHAAATYTPATASTTGSCSATYCHGNFTYGNGPQSINWGTGTSSKLSCTACHPAPPSYPHASNQTCADCHGAGYNLATSAAPPATHANGVNNDSIGNACAACHGALGTVVTRTDNPVNAAPGSVAGAKDSAGGTVTTTGATGAHLAHLGKTNFRAAAITCADCHFVPPTNDKAHATGTTQNVPDNGARATLTWGNLARGAVDSSWNGGAVIPTYSGSSTRSNGAAGSCGTVYCHGAFNFGVEATLPTPPWNGAWSATLTSTSLNCTSCHGFPPLVNGHTDDSGCATCHPDYTQAANRGTHIDGRVDQSGGTACAGCHGDDTRTTPLATLDTLGVAIGKASPPKDAHSGYGTNTNTETTVFVGAHQQHVNQVDGNPLAKPIDCVFCHGTAVSTYALTGHQGTPGQVPFSGYADTAQANYTAANPVTPTQGSCYATYCHGNFTGGNGLTSIQWGTGVPAKLGCTSCHPNQPGLPHPTNQVCADCHPAGYSKTGAATGTVVANSHVDGVVDAPTGCAACHGALKTNGVPNTDARAMPGYNGTGEDSKGNTAASAPGVGAHAVHQNPAGSQNLMTAKACAVCHPTYSTTAHANGATGFTWTTPANTGVTPSYSGSPNYTCTNYCHSNATPLGGTFAGASPLPNWTSTTNMGCASCHGNGSTGLALSSRHAKHLASGTYNYDCARCHASTGSRTAITTVGNHVDGEKDWAFDSTPVNQASATYTGTSSTPNYTCNTTYCHSNGTSTTSFGAPVNTGLNWSTGTVSAACDDCHGGNGNATNKLATAAHGAHMNVAGYTGNYACGACHGGAGGVVATGMFRAATDTADRTVTTYSAHVNGARNVSTNIAATANAMGWNSTTKACNSNYCHSSGQVVAVRTYNDPIWNSTTLADDCKGCHGRASGVAGAPDYANGGVGTNTANNHAIHVTSVASCNQCHSTSVDAAGVVNATNGLHTNGTVNVVINSTYGSPTPTWVAGSKSCSTLVAGCHTGTRQWGQTGLATCIGCHNVAGKMGTTGPNSRRPVAADFANGTTPAFRSHHVGNAGTIMGGTLTANDCAVCHMEAVVSAKGAAPTVHPTLHGASGNGYIDLRNADSTTAYFQYNNTFRGSPGTAHSGNATWKNQMSGQTDDAVNSAAKLACVGGSSGDANCSTGLDRFCISCHDADGASSAQNAGDATATAANPFADTRIANEYDQEIRCNNVTTNSTTFCTTSNQAVIDVASRVHVTARTAAGGTTTAADRDGGTGSPVGGVRAADGRMDPPEGVFSRHAIRGLATSVYSGTNTNWDNTTYWNRTNVTWASNSVMGCADCHTTDGANGASGNAHGSSSEYLLKDRNGNATEGTGTNSTATIICLRCHLGTAYVGAVHTNNGSDFVDKSMEVGLVRTEWASSGGPLYGYSCANCHGGGTASKAGTTKPTGSQAYGGFGTIHGTSQQIGTGANGATGYRNTYRFMNGASMRYYAPATNWYGNGTCYTLNSKATQTDNWGGCTKHGSGEANTVQAGPRQRTLSY